jgi:hypothetical protein
MASQKNRGQFQLLFGPYAPPSVPRNGRLRCEMRGLLRVGSWSDGLIPWPRRYQTGSIILCGDLVRAVETESVEAVSHHWGVCRNVVQKWRQALHVPESNPGTRHLRHRIKTALDSPARRRAVIRANNPKAILSSEQAPQERSHPLVSPSISRLVRDRIARTGRHINPDLRLWSEKEDKLLGTARDEQIARQINRSRGAVRARRNILGIPAWNVTYSRPWTAKEEALLGVVPDRLLAEKLKRTFIAVQARREIKHRPPVGAQRRRFTTQEDSLLKSMSNQQAARKLGRDIQIVSARRHYLASKPEWRTSP